MLSVHNISKIYDDRTALDALTLTVQKARTTVLIGPSGCGKSTLIRIMIGLILPDTGHVRFENTEVTPETALQLRHQMGYVIQDGGLFPHLNGYDNVALMARYLGWAEDRLAVRIHELTELTRFPEDGLGRYPVQLSGGQRQRVSLMRALMLDPDVLLLDEPLGALDPIIHADLQDDLRDIFRTLGKTVVMVTHDMGEAGFFGDEIVLMQDGKIIQQGTLHDLVHDPVDDFVSRFINAHRGPLDVLKD
ncbi:MAG TPA: ATP-binding cassette domain-containing protein [candidate division Zixibacteria bacterium]|jgi:osmoprotectant transport system ATP-binding protein|nr:ATP-binding cassette domain-containing protein [candidate division Zixibacteria bacterium]